MAVCNTSNFICLVKLWEPEIAHIYWRLNYTVHIERNVWCVSPDTTKINIYFYEKGDVFQRVQEGFTTPGSFVYFYFSIPFLIFLIFALNLLFQIPSFQSYNSHIHMWYSENFMNL